MYNISATLAVLKRGTTLNRNPYSEFKGTTSQYKYLHVLVAKTFGKPELCIDCGTTEAKRYDWANTGNNYGYPYVVKREDWVRLCRSCHQKRDAHLFIGKRFSGKKHKKESKNKTSVTLKTFWDNNPEWKKEVHQRSVISRLRNKVAR